MTAPPSAFPCCLGLGYVVLDGRKVQCPNCPNGIRWATGAVTDVGARVTVVGLPPTQRVEVRDPMVRDLALALDALLVEAEFKGDETWETIAPARAVLATVPPWALPPRDASAPR